MDANKSDMQNSFSSDFAKIDAHVITQEEYDEIPELDEGFFERAAIHRNGVLIRRGRPKGSKKTAVKVRFDDEVLVAFRAAGKGWQTRMNDVLREWVQTHPVL
jgi:uncharacterized protein (DUF4415 family)